MTNDIQVIHWHHEEPRINLMQYCSGLEVAAYGISKGEASSVDVVGQSPTPFAKVFGDAIGARITKVTVT